MSVYIVINGRGDRLCKDLRWRDFACFGTFPGCVKTYKIRAWAKRIADKLEGNNRIVWLPEGRDMDASGRVFSRS